MENNLIEAGKFWDERFEDEAYAYGQEGSPILGYLRSLLPQGANILFPAEGEGRNAVAAGRLGYNCTAFDLSAAGKRKAEKLAATHGVALNYFVGDLDAMAFKHGSFDAIVLVYAHFFPNLRAQYHRTFVDLLKPGGYIFVEGFDKAHIAYQAKNPGVGGPRNVDMLYDDDMLQSDFHDLKTIRLNHIQPALNEGVYHVGTASIVHYIGQKS